MVHKVLSFVTLLVVVSLGVGVAQTPATPPALGFTDSYQMNYLPSMAAGTFVNISNAGFHIEPPAGTTTGYICADIYTVQPDEQPRNCCTCPVSANAVRSLLGTDFAPSAFAAPSPAFSNFTVKIVFTRPVAGLPGNCNAGVAAAGLAPVGAVPATKMFASGGRAWATKVHTTAPTGGTTFFTETRFSEVPLSVTEYATRLVGTCAFFQTFGTGAGICSSCALGALSPGGFTTGGAQ
jgi:hypothetical protein